jgi:3-deoxy-D-manno-octulosonate 8-phosphate phosphatase (KDO 8-P phosphatase)
MIWSRKGRGLKMKALDAKARKIRMLLLDVDGVMTDGGILLGSDSIEIKRFHVHDGMGIALAKAAGILIGILTGRDSEAVRRRAKELEIDEIQQGAIDKEKGYEAILKKYGLKDEEIAYVGDDLLDIPILRRAGLSICVANGVEEAKKVSHYVTRKKGGEGAVREAVEKILTGKGKKKEAILSLLSWAKERGE